MDEKDDAADNFIQLLHGSVISELLKGADNTVRVMADVVDEKDGDVLAPKYEILTHDQWKRIILRASPPEFCFVSTRDIDVIQGLNLELMEADELQFFGVYLAGKNKIKEAESILLNAMEGGDLTATLNYSIFHFRLGDYGVYDNYALARRHAEMLFRLMDSANRPDEEREYYQKICADILSEINFQTTFSMKRFLTLLLRFLRVEEEPKINYVGPAGVSGADVEHRYEEIRERIRTAELKLLKDAMSQFIYKLEFPADMRDVEDSFRAVAGQCVDIQDEREISTYLKILGGLYRKASENKAVHERMQAEIKKQTQTITRPDENVGAMFTDLTASDRIKMKKLDARLRLRSVGELEEMAARKDMDRITALWLIHVQPKNARLLDALLQNSSVTSELKERIDSILDEAKKAKKEGGG